MDEFRQFFLQLLQFWLEENIIFPKHRFKKFIKDNFESDEYKQKHEKVRELHSLSKEVGIPLVNLAICWCLKNKYVSTVILGASKEDQLVQNLESLKYSDQLDKNIMEKIEAILKK